METECRDLILVPRQNAIRTPDAAWTFSHIEVKNSTPVMHNDEEAIQYAKGQRRHGEEVHRGDGFTMIAQKYRHRAEHTCGLNLGPSLPMS